MNDLAMRAVAPTELLMQAWIYRDIWHMEEAILLALGVSPDDAKPNDALEGHAGLIDRTRRDRMVVERPKNWLWWGERNGLPYHDDWWLAVTPEGPIGFDGRHFALSRDEMLSDAYLKQERRLITEWLRKPYWTPREAIDLSLNLHPFSTDGWRGAAPETSETITEREDRFHILQRAVEIGDISEKARAKDYVLWLVGCGYFVSEAWRRAVGISGSEEDALKAVASELQALQGELAEKVDRVRELEAEIDTLSASHSELETLKEMERPKADPDTANARAAQTRRMRSLQIALLACAVDGLGYNPFAKKSDVPKQIADMTDKLGCSLGAQSIGKHLKESAEEHVDQSAWEAVYPTK